MKRLSTWLYAIVLVSIFGIGPVAFSAGNFGGGASGSYDATAIHNTGAQSMQGPLAITCPGCGWNPSFTIPGNSKLCFNGAACSGTLNWNGGAISAAGTFTASSDFYATNGLYANGNIANTGVLHGGSIAFNDPLRFLEPTGGGPALIESSTTASAGTDYAFVLNSLNDLSSGDLLLDIREAGVARANVDSNGYVNASGFYGGFLNAGMAYVSGVATTASNTPLRLLGNTADGATAVSVKIASTNTLSTAGAKIASFYQDNGTVEKASIDKDGMLQIGVSNEAAAPTCAEGQKGKFWYRTTSGGAGTGDTLKFCVKKSDGNYVWQDIIIVP